MTTCASVLRILRDDTVTCVLPGEHAQHAPLGGADSDEPTYHQGVTGQMIMVWSTRDAGIIDTLRNAGFHDQGDHHARKLALSGRVHAALRQLDGTTGSAVALLTGMTPAQLDDLGGFEVTP